VGTPGTSQNYKQWVCLRVFYVKYTHRKLSTFKNDMFIVGNKNSNEVCAFFLRNVIYAYMHIYICRHILISCTVNDIENFTYAVPLKSPQKIFNSNYYK
jgi:hypothetical protein